MDVEKGENCSQVILRTWFLFFCNTITISLQIIVVRITTNDLGLGFRKRKIVMTSEENLERLEGLWGYSNLSSVKWKDAL